jgi:hypothetical protein
MVDWGQNFWEKRSTHCTSAKTNMFFFRHATCLSNCVAQLLQGFQPQLVLPCKPEIYITIEDGFVSSVCGAKKTQSQNARATFSHNKAQTNTKMITKMVDILRHYSFV